MSQRNKLVPTSFDALERGRASSFGSLESINEDDSATPTEAPLSQSYASRVPQNATQTHSEHDLRRRRSSIAMRFNSIRQLGGVNSIDNFVNSFQRAAAFHEITPVRRGSVTQASTENEEPQEYGQTEHRRPPLKSLLSEQMIGAEPQSPTSTIRPSHDDNTLQHQPSETTSLLTPQPSMSIHTRLGSEQNLGVSYGSISSRLSSTARHRASILIRQQVEASQRARELPDEYKDDVVERPVEIEQRPDGEVIERTIGESTVPMTIFNSTNVLIGIGILALPLAVRYSGWVIALTFLTLAAIVTAYTARILAKCLDTNTASTTYGDIAFLALGSWGRALVEVLFILELIAANVALVILFADSMHSLIPSVGVIYLKVLIAIGLLPLNFVPFKTLSVTSVLGIGCVMGIILLVFVDGFLKPQAPGSLRQVATTHAFPSNIRTVPLSLGLLMAPWGGHSVFPAIYKDMRHPQKYGKALQTTYIFTYGLDVTMAILGYLMFGDIVRDEVTANILGSTKYPRVISVILVVLIAVIPVTKIPLSNRPIQDTVNKKFLIDLRQMDAKARAYSEKSLAHRLGRGSICVLLNLVLLGVAIGFPDFDSIMALMGSALCFTICIILPITFYLKIFWGSDEIKRPERILCFVLIVICTVLAVIGTVFAVMPKDKIGVQSCDGKIACF
ncbi:hypothetical protein LTR05_000978 [Lithohypha guttulata]|uniref:Amino acid transporter transmembrane domain-containing protein n=1 Tax=Lithohypha guttulata TaxID=1690604 RepID=A0AAN7T8A7_9EURO|nr:hypothetical protein LTR05_000978 [Lithohypha guttulata]